MRALGNGIDATLRQRVGGGMVQGQRSVANTSAAGALTIPYPTAFSLQPGLGVVLGSSDISLYQWVPIGYQLQTNAAYFTILVYNLAQANWQANAGLDVWWTAFGPAPSLSQLAAGKGLGEDDPIPPYTFADPPPYLPDDPAVLAAYGTPENPWPAPPDDWTL